MGIEVNLGMKDSGTIGGFNDSIVIKNYVNGIKGGRPLDVTDFPDDYIYAGHGVIREFDADGVPNYLPQPVDADGNLSRADELIGVVRSTTRKELPITGVMTHGTINNECTKYKFDDASLERLEQIGIHNESDK